MNTANSNMASTSKGKTLVLGCSLAEMERLYEFIGSNCDLCGLGKSFCYEVQLALEEAIVNVMNYAFPNGSDGHTIELRAQLRSDSVRFDLIDDGIPFDPTTREAVDTDAPLSERKAGGLGIHLYTRMMSRLNYRRTGDGKNILTLYKNLPCIS